MLVEGLTHGDIASKTCSMARCSQDPRRTLAWRTADRAFAAFLPSQLNILGFGRTDLPRTENCSDVTWEFYNPEAWQDRIAAMEVNAESNNEAQHFRCFSFSWSIGPEPLSQVLGDHRKVLDCILQIRQAQKISLSHSATCREIWQCH